MDVRYRYKVRYYIADVFGELRWDGTVDISQAEPRPEGEIEQLIWEAATAKNIRRDCDEQGIVPGRVLVVAVVAKHG